MFGLKGNKALELQIKAAEKEALELLKDEEQSPITRAKTLRQVVQMKERAAYFILEELGNMITRFMSRGVSCVSLVPIAEAYQQALEASTSQMQIFANELAGLKHDEEIEEGYGYISERLTAEAEALIKPLRENRGKALQSVDEMIFFEILETWHNLSEKPI